MFCIRRVASTVQGEGCAVRGESVNYNKGTFVVKRHGVLCEKKVCTVKKVASALGVQKVCNTRRVASAI